MIQRSPTPISGKYVVPNLGNCKLLQCPKWARTPAECDIFQCPKWAGFLEICHVYQAIRLNPPFLEMP